MPDLNNILHQLKDHDIQPPEELFGLVAEQLKINVEGLTSDSHESDLREFERLKDNSVEPPEIVTEKIMAAVHQQTSTITPTVSLLKRSAFRIAATILLLAAVWGIYTLVSTKDNKSPGKDIVTHNDVPIQNENRPISKDSLHDIVIANRKTFRASHKKAYSRNTGSRTHQTGRASAEGYDFAIKDNDLLGSFTNFNYRQLPDFLNEEDSRSIQVKTDHSTSITVSEGMVSMMKKMYKTKRNGQFTWKAKRERKKLLRWKKADANFFDKNPAKNPMDPFDLAEFIF